MSDMKDFDRRIRLYASKVGDIGTEAVQAASGAILKELAEATPVDTGKAVSNWVVSLGNSISGEKPAYAPGSKGSTGAANRIAMLESGFNVIEGYVSGQSLPIVISNNAKHIKALNDGHSKQAPANFVETAVVAGREAVQNLRISFK